MKDVNKMIKQEQGNTIPPEHKTTRTQKHKKDFAKRNYLSKRLDKCNLRC